MAEGENFDYELQIYINENPNGDRTLEKGEHPVKTQKNETDWPALIIRHPFQLYGVHKGKDARGRSSTGQGNVAYTGDTDPAESTVFCNEC